jgi:hypothetical protein
MKQIYATFLILYQCRGIVTCVAKPVIREMNVPSKNAPIAERKNIGCVLYARK